MVVSFRLSLLVIVGCCVSCASAVSRVWNLWIVSGLRFVDRVRSAGSRVEFVDCVRSALCGSRPLCGFASVGSVDRVRNF